MKIATIGTLAAFFIINTLAFAHHGGSMYPDRETVVILEGAIIDELLYVNPHGRLLLAGQMTMVLTVNGKESLAVQLN